MLRVSSIRSAIVIARRGRAMAMPRAVCVGLMVLCAMLMGPARASAQNAAAGFSHELLYTRSGVPPGQATMRRVTVQYEPGATPTLTIGTPVDIGAPPFGLGAAGLCIAPDGDVLVGGGAVAPGAVYKVKPGTGAATTYSAGAGTPTALRIAVEPTGERAFIACTVGGEGRVARMPLAPAGPGLVFPITGADTMVTSIAFGHGRAYYVNEAAGALGVINLDTFATTRLMTGLDRPRTVMFDPHTGHLMVFRANGITQVDARPGLAAAVMVSEVSLADLTSWFSNCGATIDGLGRAIVLSVTGHVAVVDYAATRSIGHAGNTRLIAPLESWGVLAGLAPLCGPGGLRSAGCIWDNGPFDLLDGLQSQNSWANGDTRTADDFYLCAGVHRIDSITATMFSDALALTGLIEVYEDCNGEPGVLIGTYAATATDTGEVFQGLRVLALTAPTNGLWLRGGKSYWVSPVGLGNLQGTDMWYWGTSSGPEGPDGVPVVPTVRGKAGVFRALAGGVPEWTDSQSAGCNCTDFAFSLRGMSCKVLHDNGPAPDAPPQPPTAAVVAPGAPSIISSTNSDSRAADNFRVPPCNNDGGVRVCYVEAVVYTNCVPVRGVAEILENDCQLPLAPPLFVGAITRVVPLGYSVWIGGSAMPAYLVQVENAGWFLPDGRNYWLSVAVQGSGGFQQRAYFAGNAPRCGDEPGCEIRISQAAVRGAAVGSPGWTVVETHLQVPLDLAFMVAVEDRAMLAASGPFDPEPECIADADRDGVVAVADIFHFLNHWFAGCP